MKLATFDAGDGARLGALAADGRSIIDLTAAAAPDPAFVSMQALIEGGAVALGRARAIVAEPGRAPMLGLSTVRLLAPLPRPVRMRDCQLFHQHLEAAYRVMARRQAAAAADPEAAYQALVDAGKTSVHPIVRERIIYYDCNRLSVVGPEETVIWPRESATMDYELEWACIIGKGGRDIREDEAANHIFGYTIFNDLSARDVQMAVMAATLGPGAGKDFDNGNVIGPYIVTPDSIGDPYGLTMTARVNGELWSSGSTNSMFHSFEKAIALLSDDRTLMPGEIIGSGTVLGGCGLELERYPRHGDVVELEVENIGILRTTLLQGRPDNQRKVSA